MRRPAAGLARFLRARRAPVGPLVRVVELAQGGNPGWTLEALTAALDGLAAEGIVTRGEKLLCPVTACGLALSAGEPGGIRNAAPIP